MGTVREVQLFRLVCSIKQNIARYRLVVIYSFIQLLLMRCLSRVFRTFYGNSLSLPHPPLINAEHQPGVASWTYKSYVLTQPAWPTAVYIYITNRPTLYPHYRYHHGACIFMVNVTTITHIHIDNNCKHE